MPMRFSQAAMPKQRQAAISAMLAVLVTLAAPQTSFAAERGSSLSVNTDTVLSDLDDFPAPDSFTLKNGMRVLVIPDHRAPVVTHMVWYGVGSADEAPGRTGLAHFLEHLMFKGTDEIEPGEFSRSVMRNGGELNAFTSYDFTAYYERIAVDRLPLVMRMEADRMTDLALTDEIVLPERDVVLEEMRSRLLNDPSAMLRADMDRALFGEHPYGTPIIGEKADVESLDRQKALDFYKQFYRPSNAVLIVAGDVTMESVRPLAEKFYGTIENDTATPERQRAEIARLKESIEIVREDERAAQSRWMRAYLAPSYGHARNGEAAALDVLAYVLGGSETSRLYRSLVADKKIASAAGAWYWGDRLDRGTAGLYALPASGATPEAVERAAEQVIAQVVAEGISEEELERAKTRLAAEAVYSRDSQDQLAYAYGSGLMTGQSLEEIAAWPEMIAKVTLADVQDAARDVFGTDVASVTGILLPKKES